jgi:glutamine cyclotransferase
MKAMQIFFCLLLTCITFFSSCQNGNSNSNLSIQQSNSEIANTNLVEIVKPLNGSSFAVNKIIIFEFSVMKDQSVFDSIQLFIDGAKISVLTPNKTSIEWDSKNSRLGRLQIKATVFSKGVEVQNLAQSIMLLSDKKPIEYSYKIIKVYPHSRNAYTQGLIYENGYFYESDGEYRKSALRKVKLETGDATQMVNIDPTIFAEGLALRNNKLYQLSYREQTGFIYDKTTFKLERKFKFDLIEGWGLEYNGKHFLATDGSSYIYYMDPESFTKVGFVQVVDDKGPIENINELELINGQLFANVYTQNIVLIIDPLTGKVLGKIDFAGLLPEIDYSESTDVLNGIAWNPANGHLFLTGKNWPKLFEIVLENKK